MLSGSILQQLWESHRLPGDDRSLNLGVYYKNTLVALCHALEDAILYGEYQPLVMTAFQRGKWYLQEADRYGEIAEKSPQVVILASPDAGFAEHPTSQRSQVSLIHLDPTDPVAQEWHLIIVSSDYMAMVLCQELAAADYGVAGVPQEDLERKFYGLWTFDPMLVMETAGLMVAQVDRYDGALAQKLKAQLAEIEARSQAEGSLCHLPTAEHLGEIVSRVVDYLQSSEQAEDEKRQSYWNANANLKTNLVANELQAYLRLAELIDQTDLSHPGAAAEVTSLAEAIAQLLDLPAWQIQRIRLAGLLHRIAFLRRTSQLFSRESLQQEAELLDACCTLEPGVQVLRKLGRLRSIATILAHQTEWWNGRGTPAGLAGEAIPIESRILSLVADFQQRLSQLRQQDPRSLSSQLQVEGHSSLDASSNLATSLDEASAARWYEQALACCREQAGDRHDPKLVEILALLVGGLQQGLALPKASSKAMAELWQTPS